MSTPSLLLAFLLISAPLLSAGDDRTAWVQGTVKSALNASAACGRPVLVYCWEKEQSSCVTMYDSTLRADSVMTAMEKWVCFSAEKGTPAGDEVLEKYQVKTLPAVLFLSNDGDLVDLLGGVIGAGQFIRELDRILAGKDTLRELIVRAEDRNDPAHLDACLQLAFRYRSIGETERSESQFKAIRAADPRANTLAGSRAHFMVVAEKAAKDAEDNTLRLDWNGRRLTFRGQLRSWSVKPFKAWAKKVKNTEGRFEAWDNIGEITMTQGDRSAALSAWQTAHKYVPDYRVMDWCSTIANTIMHYDGKRSLADKKFALKLATHCAKVAKALDDQSAEYRERFPNETRDAVIARYLEPLGYAQKFNGQHSKSIATLERCVELDPENEKYQSSLELIRSGNWPPPPSDGK